MRLNLMIYLVSILFISCEQKVELPNIWEIKEVIPLDNVHPIGIASDGKNLYISDGDNNRVVKINSKGDVLFEYLDLERPMHIDFNQLKSNLGQTSFSTTLERAILIPEYGKDSITIINDNERVYLPGTKNLDAPAAISVSKQYIAIADFYNHQILFYNGEEWKRFGKEGNKLGELYHPTDVQIFNDTLFVADAYNNRGQLFTLQGEAIRTFGEEEGFNAATGIYISDYNIYLTDFENNRVFNYNRNFEVLQEISNAINKPTDILKNNGMLYITNYKNGELVVLKTKKDKSS